VRVGRRKFTAALLLAVLLGLAIRWLVLRGASWRIDFDEGMVGLQVLRLLRGEFTIFHPGQPYLGNVESYLIAPFFALFGANNPTLKLIPLLLSGAYIATIGLLGKAAFSARVGALAALAAAIAPTYMVVLGLKAWGSTIETLVLGNLLLLMTIRLVHGTDHPTRDWALLGLIGGLAFYISWLSAFFGIPAALILFAHLRRTGRKAWRWVTLCMIMVIIGSLPLWLFNLRGGWATFVFLLGGEKGSSIVNAPRILKHFTLDLAPRLVSGDPAWHILSSPATWALVAIYGLGLSTLIFTRNRRDHWLLTSFVVCFLPAYILSGFGNNALNSFGIDATGRYVLMLHSVLPIGLALLADRLTSNPLRPPLSKLWRGGRGVRFLASAPLILTLTLNLVGLTRIDPTPVFTSPYYRDQPAALQPLIDLLDARKIDHIWTDVGIAHVLMFETHERILAADYYDTYYANGPIRFPEVIASVARAERVAYVELIRPGQRDTHIERAFEAAGIAYERLTPTPELLVIIPDTRVDPATVLPGLGFQY
jgi:hypothetical protein